MDNPSPPTTDTRRIIIRYGHAEVLLGAIGVAYNEGQLSSKIYMDGFLARVRCTWPDLARKYSWLPWPEHKEEE